MADDHGLRIKRNRPGEFRVELHGVTIALMTADQLGAFVVHAAIAVAEEASDRIAENLKALEGKKSDG